MEDAITMTMQVNELQKYGLKKKVVSKPKEKWKCDVKLGNKDTDTDIGKRESALRFVLVSLYLLVL
jgi:hypothetical protein